MDIKTKVQSGFQNNIAQYEKNERLSEATDKLWEIVDETSRSAEGVLAKVPIDSLSNREMTALLMLCNCLSDLMAGVHTLMLGLHRPAGTIFRACTENIALSTAIELKEEIYTQYRDGKFHAPDAISVAKKIFPEIGKIYGVLSEKFVHEPHETIGRAIRQTGSTTEFMLVPPIDGVNLLPQIVLLNQAAICSVMIGEIFEWAFAEYLTELTYWTRIPDGNIQTKTSAGKTIAIELAQILENALEEKEAKDREPDR